MKNRYILLRLRIIIGIIRKRKVSARKLFNATRCFLSYWMRSGKSSRAPFLINFELWNECNEKCLFCRTARGEIYDQNPNGGGEFIPKGKMPYEMYAEIINQVKDYLLMAVLYVNGEPLLYKDIFRAIKLATEHGVATTIATNGILLNEKKCSQLLNAGIDFIKIAVSGYSQEVYSIQHRLGDIEKIKRNIISLARMNRQGGHGAIIMIDYILYNHNRDEVDAFRNFANELGIMFNLRQGNPKGMEDTESPQTTAPLPVNIPCDWLWKILTVNWNGDLLPCCDYTVWSGSRPYARFEMNETRIAQVWNGDEIMKMRRTHATKGRKPIPICSVCSRRGTAFKF